MREQPREGRRYSVETEQPTGDLVMAVARQVRREDFRRFTHVIALDHDNLASLRKLAPPDATAELSLLLDHVPGREGQAVADPYFGEEDGFDVTWADVTAGAAGLADRLRPSAR